jgi:hypothetical protein
MSLKDEIRDLRTDPQGGYGAFDEEQMYNREEDSRELCEHCDLPVEDCKCYSPCCGAYMGGGNGDASFEDYGICPECHEFI